MNRMKQGFLAVICLLAGSYPAVAQKRAEITLNTAEKGAVIPATLHGVFFEEISHAGEGGLYGEMVQNRGFEDHRIPAGTKLENGWLVPFPQKPHFMLHGQVSDWKMEWPLQSQWPAWQAENNAQLSLVTDHPLNAATPHAMQVKVTGKGAALVNEGFWGMNVEMGAAYRLSFFANTVKGYTGKVTASLQTLSGQILADTVFQINSSASWKKYYATLTAKGSDPAGRLVLTFHQSGTLLLDMVSLFPVHTFRDRPNGMRADLATLIQQMKPSFVRWPGGCYVEGITVESAPDWKTTLGPVEQRTASYSPWGYWSSNGFGYHEYLQFCEDINAAALYVFNVGISCEYRSGTFVPNDSVAPYIQSALDAIEYAVGPITSRWGKQRAANGHPAPFPLRYVEVGNEQHGPDYAKRYNLFYDAIHKKYPQIEIIASMGIGDVNRHTLDSMQHTDIVDEHAYKDAGWSLRNFDHFDKYKRGSWQMYVGEYATNAGVGNGNMQAALSDAVYVMSMEKNADLVKMSSYAPLLVNEHDVDWPVNLIHFNAGASFGRISYYALNMLNDHKATFNYPVTTTLLPEKNVTPKFSGSIGLATWDTEAEYKDITVVQQGDTVYSSRRDSQLTDWLPVRGSWNKQPGLLAQTAAGAQQLAILKDHHFNAYTLSLKARKTGGVNVFIIPFAVKDTNTCLRAHIGSWLNSNAMFESLTNGYDVAGISNPVRLKAPLESGRWYDIRLEVSNDEVKCFVDNSLLMTYREPQKLFSIAGKDEKNGDIILKIVNAGESAVDADIRLDGAAVSPVAQVITLTADKPGAENSFASPEAYTPHTSTIQNAAAQFSWKVPALSVNIIRLKSPRIAFNVRMPEPAAGVYEVEMNYKADSTSHTTLKLPVWTPGYYQLMDYAGQVKDFHVHNTANDTLSWHKTNANSWEITHAPGADIKITYKVAARRNFVATTYLDKDHGYITPAGVFMHPAGKIDWPVAVTVQPYGNWQVATGMDTLSKHTYTAASYDVLYDSPLLIGELESFPAFKVKGIPHYFTAFQPGGFNRRQFMNDLEKIVTTAAAIIGDIPYNHYTFLGIGPGQGGIEHLNSAAVSFTGEELNDKAARQRTYSFLAHEYFHHYNVKRIRPVELGPFNYDAANRTRLLWVSEGFTVYYEYLVLQRAGLMSGADLLQALNGHIQSCEQRPGNRVQSVTVASYETWDDGPFGGDPAKTISCYEKGPVLAFLLDLRIRHATGNKQSLDDVMRALYRQYYLQLQRGFTPAEFRETCETIAGQPLADFFVYVETPAPVNYQQYLAYAGLTMNKMGIHTLPSPNTLQQDIRKAYSITD